MITDRDLQVINTLDEFHCATAPQIHRIHYNTSYRRCQKRLQDLHDMKEIKRDTNSLNSGFMYFINRPKQELHDLLRTEFYSHVCRLYDVQNWQNEYSIGNVRADAYGEISGYRIFLEIHLSNTFDQNKYETLYSSNVWKEWRSFPRIVIVTNHRIKLQPTKLNFKIVSQNMKDIKNILL